MHLADGSIVTAQHQCVLTIRIKGYKSTVTCFVIDLNQKFDVILGEDWLVEERVSVDFSTKAMHIQKRDLRIVIQPRPHEELHDPEQACVLLTATQVKRCMRKGSKHFVINVIDDGVTPSHSSVPSAGTTASKNDTHLLTQLLCEHMA